MLPVYVAKHPTSNRHWCAYTFDGKALQVFRTKSAATTWMQAKNGELLDLVFSTVSWEPHHTRDEM